MDRPNRILQFIGVLCLIFIFPVSLSAQVIWSEDFSAPASPTLGGNNNTANPANDWTSSCPTCIPTGDWFEVRSGQMEGLDTNGPATLTTESIDISTAPNGVDLSIDLSQAGNMENCSDCGSGCVCIDFIEITYSLDGAPPVTMSDPANGGPCNVSCSGSNYVTLGDFTAYTYTGCIPPGNSLVLAISVQNWAASEVHRFDNISLSAAPGTGCVLPVQLQSLNASRISSGVQIDWSASNFESFDKFLVERSTIDGGFETLGEVKGEINSEKAHSYQLLDAFAPARDLWYRIRSIDMNGNSQTSQSVLVRGQNELGADLILWPNPAREMINIRAGAGGLIRIRLYDLQGRLRGETQYDEGIYKTNWSLESMESGLYLFEILTGQGTVTRKLLKE